MKKENEMLDKLAALEKMLTEMLTTQKEIFSFREAAIYLNLLPSYLYKLPYSKEKTSLPFTGVAVRIPIRKGYSNPAQFA